MCAEETDTALPKEKRQGKQGTEHQEPGENVPQQRFLPEPPRQFSAWVVVGRRRHYPRVHSGQRDQAHDQWEPGPTPVQGLKPGCPTRRAGRAFGCRPWQPTEQRTQGDEHHRFVNNHAHRDEHRQQRRAARSRCRLEPFNAKQPCEQSRQDSRICR